MRNPDSHWKYTIEEWSRPPFTTMLDAIPEPKVIYDIGANVGAWAHLAHERWKDAEIHCFEPVKSNYEALVARVPYVKAHQWGIYYGAESSRVGSRGDGANIGAFFIEQINAGEPRVFSEEVIDLKPLTGKPDLIKLDVEGAEENIIEHSDVVKNCPWIILEWHPDSIPPFERDLPNHKVVMNVERNQYLLCLK